MFAVTVAAGCTATDDGAETTTATGSDRVEPVAPPLQPGQVVTLELAAVPTLPEDLHYAFWAVSGDERILMSRFVQGTEPPLTGEPVALTREPNEQTGESEEVGASPVSPGTIARLDGFEVTVEHDDSVGSEAPSGPVLVAADWTAAGSEFEMTAQTDVQPVDGAVTLDGPDGGKVVLPVDDATWPPRIVGRT